MTPVIVFLFVFNALWLSALFAGTAWAIIRLLKINSTAGV